MSRETSRTVVTGPLVFIPLDGARVASLRNNYVRTYVRARATTFERDVTAPDCMLIMDSPSCFSRCFVLEIHEVWLAP